MKSTIIKSLSFISAIVVLWIGSLTPAYAKVDIRTASVNDHIGVSGDMDSMMVRQLRSDKKPTSTWNCATIGKYHFQGSFSASRLYTNYLFIGKERYAITIDNRSDANLRVDIMKVNWIGGDSRIQTEYISPNGLLGFSTPKLSSNDKIYLLFSSFDHNVKIDGYIR